jgi:hypothetical protein
MRVGWVIVICLPKIAMGQGSCSVGSLLRLSDSKVAFSTMVTMPTQGDPPESFGKQVCGDALAQDNMVHRVLYDRENRPYFGYDVRISPIPATKMFRIEVAAIKGKINTPDFRPGRPRATKEIDGKELRSFQKFPEPVSVADGDRVTLPVMQDPKTGAVVVIDSFEIGGTSTGVQTLPNLPGIPKQPPVGTLLHLEEPELSSIAVSDLGNNPEMGVTGPVVWVYTPRLGRILLSAGPRPGYFKKAFAMGARIRVEEGVEIYTFKLRAPPIAQPGTWQLWFRREPEFRPPPDLWKDQELRKGTLAIGMER